MITAINSEVDYKAALAEIEQLIDRNVRAGTPEGDRLNLLTLLVRDYEQKRIEIEAPDPIDAIKFRMEQMNLMPRDLVPLLGSRSKVSEVLSRKRPLTLSMARALYKGLRIPAKALLQEQFLFDLDEGAVEWERFPIREMVARGWIKGEVTDLHHQAKDVMHRFFAPLGKRLGSECPLQADSLLLAFRKTNGFLCPCRMERSCLYPRIANAAIGEI